MARALLVVAAMALFIGLAAAQLKICDDKKAPSAPWNTLLTKNVYEGGSSSKPLLAAVARAAPGRSNADADR